jgi:cobalamin biosynthesis Mg chelatase CobN
MEEERDPMQMETDQTTSSNASLLVVWVVLLAVAGVVATVLWMLRA